MPCYAISVFPEYEILGVSLMQFLSFVFDREQSDLIYASVN